jgi:hypothetical protein
MEPVMPIVALASTLGSDGHPHTYYKAHNISGHM